ncbi:MAG: energy-coupling factor transporter transmembrane protein EcfT [Oscillospiraceae bacterium]|nr:energy-coupling factor transporter transmembrane protein EcfT [Oscillospiraceae bacterium]
MLKDITIGQYFGGESFIHRLDPRNKIIMTALLMAAVFVSSGFAGYGVIALFLIICYMISGIPFRMILKSIKPIIPIIVFTSILNLFFIKEGDILFEWRFIAITDSGVRFAFFLVARIFCLVVGASLITYTTKPMELTDGIESLFGPLKRIKFPVHEVAMMMTIALRFVPTLIEETDKIMSAQKARGASLDTGGLVKRVKALIPVLIPLFISAFRRAHDLAVAMECRCYNGGEGRTKMKKLRFGFIDIIGAFAMIMLIAGIVVLNILGVV